MRFVPLLLCSFGLACTVRATRENRIPGPATHPATHPAAQPAAAPTVQIRVGGDYPTEVRLTSDECGGSEVRSFPTLVTHAAGDTLLTLFHAGARYAGTIELNGRFSTTPLTQVFGETSYVVAMSGQFTRGGFAATVTVDRTDARFPRGCRYVAQWTATLGRGENVIP